MTMPYNQHHNPQQNYGHLPPTVTQMPTAINDPHWQERQQAEADAAHKAMGFRPDGPPMRELRVLTYVMVIITCIALLLTMFELWSFVHQVQQAIQSWKDAMTTTGILGD